MIRTRGRNALLRYLSHSDQVPVGCVNFSIKFFVPVLLDRGEGQDYDVFLTLSSMITGDILEKRIDCPI